MTETPDTVINQPVMPTPPAPAPDVTINEPGGDVNVGTPSAPAAAPEAPPSSGG